MSIFNVRFISRLVHPVSVAQLFDILDRRDSGTIFKVVSVLEGVSTNWRQNISKVVYFNNEDGTRFSQILANEIDTGLHRFPDSRNNHLIFLKATNEYFQPKN